MSILDTILDRTKGTRWYAIFIGATLAAFLWSVTGPTIQWVVTAYAAEKLDTMLQQRGITKESFAAVQQKLKEIDSQTDGVKKDLQDLKSAIGNLTQEQTRVKQELKEGKRVSEEERKEIKASIDRIYNYLLNNRNPVR